LVSIIAAVAGQPLRGVTIVVFTALKTTDPATGILTTHASQTSMNVYQTGDFRSKKKKKKKFKHHSVPSTYGHNIRHFALLLR
jgi:hypothetical protein